MNTNVATAPAASTGIVNGFVFKYQPPGSYLRPTVYYTEDLLNLDKLFAAYEQWWSQHIEMPFDFTHTGDTLDIGVWQVKPQVIRGSDPTIELDEDTPTTNLVADEDIVRFHIVGLKGNQLVTTNDMTEDLDHGFGVIEFVNEFNPHYLNETFIRSGWGPSGNFVEATNTFYTTFDIIMHPTATFSSEFEETTIVTAASMTMRDSAEHADRAIDVLLTHHSTRLKTMNTTDTSTPADDQHDATVAQIAAEVDAASQTNTQSASQDAPVEITGDVEYRVITEPATSLVSTATAAEGTESTTATGTVGYTELQPVADVAATTAAFVQVGEAVAQPPVTLTTTVDVTTVGEGSATTTNQVGVHDVDVSRLMSEGLGGAGANSNRNNKKNKGNGPRPAQAVEVKREAKPIPEARRPRPTPQPNLAIANAFQRNPKALEVVKAFISTTRDSMDPATDGVEHINIAGSARTELGKKLDLNASLAFNYGELGNFNSIGAVWCYLSADPNKREESLRNLSGTRARQIAYKHGRPNLPGFDLVIADATWWKITSHPELVEQIVGNDLPYKLYHPQEDGQGLPVVTNLSRWYVQVINEIARTLKKIKATGNMELVPNFSFLAPSSRPDDRYSRDSRQGDRRSHQGERSRA